MYLTLGCDVYELIKNTFCAPQNKQKKKKDTLNFEYTDPQKNLVRNILFTTECTSNCWWCRHTFKQELHIGCPVKYNQKDNTYITEGIFCSLNCAKAYLSEKMCSCESFYKDSPMLIHTYACELGYNGPIKQAPSWKLLKAYGGYMSISDFRNETSLQIKETLNCRFEDTNTSRLINTIYLNSN